MKVYYNGKFYIERGVFAEAIALDGDTITAVGKSEELLLRFKGSESRDMGNKTIIPGINDSHLHLADVGRELKNPDLRSAGDVQEVIDIIKSYMDESKEHSKFGISFGGWNQENFNTDKRFLNRFDLDMISKEVPIMLTRVCGHVAAVNTKALELKGTLDVHREGIVSENDIDTYRDLFPEPDLESMISDLLYGMNHALSYGITSVSSNDVWNIGDNDGFKVSESIYEKGLGKIRYNLQMRLNSDELELFDKEIRNKKIYSGKHLTLGPVKVFKDGSLGGRTALLRKPYKDDPDNIGIEVISDGEHAELIKKCNTMGLQVVTHAIGDSAVEKTINAIVKANGGSSNPLRHGIIHNQITDTTLLERIADNNITVFYQPVFLATDMDIVEARVGQELASKSYAFNTLDKLGGRISYSTDSPIEDINPFICIYTAVTRQNGDGLPQNGFYPDEKVDVYTAVDAYTLGSAYNEHKDTYKGRIKEGHLGDFIVLDRDIFSIPEVEIKDTKVLETIIGGETVYKRIEN